MYNQLLGSPDAVWSLLLASGYLKVIGYDILTGEEEEGEEEQMYELTLTNRESGFGRYDVMLEPKNQQEPAFILEFKVYDSEEEGSLQDTVKTALTQIEEKQYEAALNAKGIPAENIHKYGFAFEGKKVLIG